MDCSPPGSSVYEDSTGKNTQTCTKKGLNDPDNQDGVTTQLEKDIWDVKSSEL